jgi:hypothetical protein
VKTSRKRREYNGRREFGREETNHISSASELKNKKLEQQEKLLIFL